MLHKETQTSKYRTDNVNIATSSFGDPEAGDTQEAELENEARTRKRSQINQVAFAGQECEGYSSILCQ